MKLGFVSAILDDLELPEVLRIAAGEGYDCVEVACWPKGKAERRYAGVTHIDVETLTAAKAEEINDLCDELGVGISALGYYVNPLSPDRAEAEASVAHLRKVIEAAPLLGLNTVGTFIGRDWTQSVDAQWPRLVETWKPIVALAEEKGVRLGIENCPMLFSMDEWPGGKNIATSPAIWRRLFESLPSDNLGLNYDPSHMVWQRMDWLRPMREFADKLFHTHAKDCRVDVERLNDVGILALPPAYHTPKLPGLGDIQWGAFVGVLADVGFDGAVCVEVEDRAYEGSPAKRLRSLRLSATHLRQFIPKP